MSPIGDIKHCIFCLEASKNKIRNGVRDMLKDVEEERVKEILENLSKKYNKRERIFQMMFAKSQNAGYNIHEFKELLKEFYCY